MTPEELIRIQESKKLEAIVKEGWIVEISFLKKYNCWKVVGHIKDDERVVINSTTGEVVNLLVGNEYEQCERDLLTALQNIEISLAVRQIEFIDTLFPENTMPDFYLRYKSRLLEITYRLYSSELSKSNHKKEYSKLNTPVERSTSAQ